MLSPNRKNELLMRASDDFLVRIPTLEYMTKQKILGAWGEERACEFLLARDKQIIARNYHAQGGEIDIIAYDKITKVYLLVEVKTRRNELFGSPLQSINPKKYQSMIRSALRYFVVEKRMKEIPTFTIQVITIMLTTQGLEIEYLDHIDDIPESEEHY